jgi:glycosyltransferase involved in cell wall biosynthesis
MKLLIVSQYFWPENFRINDLAQELVLRGHEVTVLTGLPNYPDGKIFKEFANYPDKFNNLSGVTIVRVPLSPRGKGGMRLLLNYITFAVTACVLGPWHLRGKKFDAVLTYQLSPVTVGLPGALLAWLKNVPMAMWVLDLWPDTLKAIGVVKSPKLLGWVGKLVAFIYRRCDLILAQSKSFIPKIKDLSGQKIPVVYFPSWAEDIFKVNAVVPAREVPDGESVFSVMFAGNIGEAQDFACILSAASLLKDRRDIRWLIVGDGRMTSWVKSEIDALGLKQSVLLFGRHPVERMPEFFAHADAMLVTLADQEIFGMTIPGKLQSYFAAGMPVIAALNGEGAAVIQEAQAGLTCMAGDAEGLAALVVQMSKMSLIDRKKMGINGLKFSKREFDRQMIVDMTESHLMGLIA